MILNLRSNRLALASLLLCCGTMAAVAQESTTNKAPVPSNNANATAAALTNDEKAEQIVRRAIDALGGSAYLAVQTITSRGLLTPFDKGISQLPSMFTDYYVLPDHDRTEFRISGLRTVQTNNGDQGWIYDNASRTIKDMKPTQIAEFRLTLRTSLDNVLRGWWHKEGAMLSYVGRREAGLGRRNETVRITYPDGFSVDFEFGAKDGLPAKAIYKHKPTAEGEEVMEEDRYARYLNVGGLNVPFIIDHYRAGDQMSRISYDTIEFNRPIPDSMFTKPANIKAIK